MLWDNKKIDCLMFMLLGLVIGSVICNPMYYKKTDDDTYEPGKYELGESFWDNMQTTMTSFYIPIHWYDTIQYESVEYFCECNFGQKVMVHRRWIENVCITIHFWMIFAIYVFKFSSCSPIDILYYMLLIFFTFLLFNRCFSASSYANWFFLSSSLSIAWACDTRVRCNRLTLFIFCIILQ